MKAALDQDASERYAGDIRTLLRDKNVAVRRHRARRRERSRALPRRRRRATARSQVIATAFPDLRARASATRAASCAWSARSSPRRRSASRNGALQQNIQRCATASTSSAWPSRSSSSRAPTASWCSCPACRTPRAPRTSSAAPRRSRCAWSTRRRRASGETRFAQRPACRSAPTFLTERSGAPVLVKKQVSSPATASRTRSPASTSRPAARGARRASTTPAARIMRQSRARTSRSAWR